MFKIKPVEPISIKVDYEWIIEQINKHSIDIDQYELEKVENILRKLDREQSNVREI
jgi:hypothetical protein